MPISDPSQQATVSIAKRTFVGRFGIRAGWSLIIFFAVLFCLNYGISTVVIDVSDYVTHHSATPAAENAAHTDKNSSVDLRAQGLIKGESVGFVSIALASLILARIERRSIGIYGIGRVRVKDLLLGLLAGVTALSAFVAVLRQAHLLFFDARALHGLSIVRFGLAWSIGFFFVGITEEYLLRGYFLFTLERGVFGLGKKISPGNASTASFWLAAFLSSVAFAALHIANPGETAPGILGVFVLGMLRCYALWRTGSLWWSIAMHAAWDWSQSFLWGVPDSGQLCVGRLFNTHPAGNPLLSGGAAGPEGSLFLLPTILLLFIFVRLVTSGSGTLARLRNSDTFMTSAGT
jgi:membrane protease YdiL (CAAX protease family)